MAAISCRGKQIPGRVPAQFYPSSEYGNAYSLLRMARPNTMRWSGRSQDLLIRAVADSRFIIAMQGRGVPESQLRLWIAQTDVPVTFRGQMRGWLEDWAHANA